MKTLTAKLAVAALLVTGAAQAADLGNSWTQFVTGSMTGYNVYSEAQNAVNTWYGAQSKNPNRFKRALSSAVSYVKPLVVSTASVALAAVANGYECSHTPTFVKNKAVGLLAGLTVVNALYNNRTPADVTEDAALVAQVEASGQAAEQAAVTAQPAVLSAAAKARK